MKPRTAMLCLILAAPALQADENALGLQLTLTRPQGDLKTVLDGKSALGFGLHSLGEIGGGEALVYRFDLVRFKRSEADVELRLSELRLGVDWQYYFKGRVGKGAYGLAAFGVGWGTLDLKVADYRDNQTKASFSLGAGLGYLVTDNVGVEVRYTSMKYSFDILAAHGAAIIPPEDTYSAPRVDITLLVRF